jgi:hypothetical protein
VVPVAWDGWQGKGAAPLSWPLSWPPRRTELPSITRAYLVRIFGPGPLKYDVISGLAPVPHPQGRLFFRGLTDRQERQFQRWTANHGKGVIHPTDYPALGFCCKVSPPTRRRREGISTRRRVASDPLLGFLRSPTTIRLPLSRPICGPSRHIGQEPPLPFRGSSANLFLVSAL